MAGQIDQDRLERLFPTIYVTLVSILLGLALEDLLSQVGDADYSDPWVWMVGISLLTFYVSAWTGYALLAITQQRRPRIMDTVNVFFVAVGLFLLNDSVVQPHAYFFYMVSIYFAAGVYAVHYNVAKMRASLPFATSFADYKGPILALLPHVVGFPIVGWMSSQGKLGAVPELVLGATVIIASVIWISSFFTMWNGFLDRAREVGSADRSENTGGQQT